MFIFNRIIRQSLLVKILALVVISLFLFSSQTMAEEQKKLPSISSLLRNKILWTVSDLTRLVEELRRTEDQWEKQLLVEEVEAILFQEVEFPFYIHSSGEENSSAVNVAAKEDADRIVLSELFAKAFALAGIARAYEGFSLAGNDYLEIAKKVFPEVETLTIKIDSFDAPRTIKEWMEDARQKNIDMNLVRVTFHGKSGTPSQKVLEKLSHDTVSLESDQPNSSYILYAAVRDFLKGISSGIRSEKPATEFNVYLVPGRYKLIVNLEEKYESLIEIYPNEDRNHLLVEGLRNGFTAYPSPSIQGVKWVEKTN